jgi:DNA-binding transcriptional LysR family regulator
MTDTRARQSSGRPAAAMTAHQVTARMRVVFDARLPHARWGPLFHVFCLEQPGVRLDWQPTGFPRRDQSLLQGADVGLFLEPPPEAGLRQFTIDASSMVVVVAAGDRLALNDDLSVADILDCPFPGGPSLDPQWTAFWTLDAQRGGLPNRTDDDVRSAEDGLEVVAAGRAIATIPAWVAGGLAHPGVVALPLRDGPQVRTRLVWNADDGNPTVRSLVDLAAAWTSDGGADPTRP